MANPQKRKGSAAELAVAKWLVNLGWVHAERSRAGWREDRGDIDGIPGCTIEVKAEKKFDLPGYLRELKVEMANARAWTGTVILKRRGSTDVNDWYAIMPAELWAELMLLLDKPSKGTAITIHATKVDETFPAMVVDTLRKYNKGRS